MNHSYRLVFNGIKNAWKCIPEIAKSRSKTASVVADSANLDSNSVALSKLSAWLSDVADMLLAFNKMKNSAKRANFVASGINLVANSSNSVPNFSANSLPNGGVD